MNEKTILEKSYRSAGKLNANTVPDSVRKDIDLMVKKIESNKSLVSAVTTSLIKKFPVRSRMYVYIEKILLMAIQQGC